MPLSDHDRALLSWFDRMAKATHTLTEREDLSLSAWLAAGEKRSTWEGWEGIIGPMPEERKKPTTVFIERRRSA